MCFVFTYRYSNHATAWLFPFNSRQSRDFAFRGGKGLRGGGGWHRTNRLVGPTAPGARGQSSKEYLLLEPFLLPLMRLSTGVRTAPGLVQASCVCVSTVETMNSLLSSTGAARSSLHSRGKQRVGRSHGLRAKGAVTSSALRHYNRYIPASLEPPHFQ